MQKKILVTGECGFVGANLVPKLIEQGAEVKVLASVYGRFSPQNDRHSKIAGFLKQGSGNLSHSYFVMRAFFSENKLNERNLSSKKLTFGWMNISDHVTLI